MIKTTVLVAALVSLGVTAPAEKSRIKHPSHDEESLRQVLSLHLNLWLSAVESHSPGREDRAVALISSWPQADLDKVLKEAWPLALIDAPVRKRAAVLHADIAVLRRSEDGYALPPGGTSAHLIKDGSFVGMQAGTFHWRLGRRILERVEPDDDVLLWYRATSAFLQRWNEYSELEPHLKRARARFPDDAVLLLYEGTLREAYAGARVQHWLKTMRGERDRDLSVSALTGTLRPTTIPARIGDTRRELKEAERLFQKALKADPGLVEARIRLAHVRGLRGRHEEAVADLRRVVREELGPRMLYDAWLLLGCEEIAVGRRGAARDAFGRARRLHPGAQSPWMGLSLAARVEGDRPAALRLLDLLGGAAGTERDPWWTFSNEHEPDADTLLAEMRRRLAP